MVDWVNEVDKEKGCRILATLFYAINLINCIVQLIENPNYSILIPAPRPKIYRKNNFKLCCFSLLFYFIDYDIWSLVKLTALQTQPFKKGNYKNPR